MLYITEKSKKTAGNWRKPLDHGCKTGIGGPTQKITWWIWVGTRIHFDLANFSETHRIHIQIPSQNAFICAISSSNSTVQTRNHHIDKHYVRVESHILIHTRIVDYTLRRQIGQCPYRAPAHTILRTSAVRHLPNAYTIESWK